MAVATDKSFGPQQTCPGSWRTRFLQPPCREIGRVSEKETGSAFADHKGQVLCAEPGSALVQHGMFCLLFLRNKKSLSRADMWHALVCGRYLALAMSVALGLLTQGAYADDWVMAFHDSRHTGQTPEVVTPPMTVAWTWRDTEPYDTGNGGKFFPLSAFWLPIYYQGKLCVQGGNNANRVFCLNPSNGTRIWEWSNPGYAQSGAYLFQFDNYPTAVNGRIVNASTDFTASLDAATGGDAKVAYNTNGGWPFGGTASWNNMAYIQYVRTDDGTEGFNIVQDPAAWSYTGGYARPDNTTTYSDYSFRVPAVDNYTVYVNTLARLNAVDATTGRLIWAWGQMNFNASPAVSNGVVYFYSYGLGQMTALNSAQAAFSTSGTQVPVLWAVPMAPAYSPIVSDGTVYAGSEDGYFYALDAATGARKWSFKTRTAFGSLQIPAISGDLIYVPGADGILYALQKNTGVEVWRYTGTAAWGPVVVAGGMVFASDLTNTLYAFRPQAAAIGPAVTALSTSRAANSAAVSVNLTGSGFFAGGAASAVQSIYLDNSAGTVLGGYTVAGDQSITGVAIPAGMAAGAYHIKVQTSAGKTVNEPAFQVETANTSYLSPLGQSTGPYGFGTNLPFQRHLARTSNGTLVAVYIGPQVNDGGAQYPTYNFSHDGGLTWSGQGQLFLSNNGTVIWAPSTSIWIDAQDHIDISSIQWPSYNQTFQKFAMNDAGVMSPDPSPPNYPSGGKATYPGPLVSESGGRLWLALENGGVVTAYYSDNGGQNWTKTPQINQAAGTSPVMVLYGDKPAVIYADGGSLAWSVWNGQSWSSRQILPGPITGVQQAMSAAVTSNGRVHLVYSKSSGGVYYVSYSASIWSIPVALDATGTSPSLTTDGNNLWCFYGNSAGDLVYRRTNSGQWNSALAITSDGNRNTAPSTLTLSPGGQIPVVWTSGSPTGYQVKAAVVPGDSVAAPAPVLTITRTHTGSFFQGQTGATYSVIVGNAALAGPSTSTVSVTDIALSGLTLVSMSGTGWSCTGATCTRSDALNPGASYPAMTIAVNVAADAGSPLAAQASVSGGGSATSTATDNTVIMPTAVLSVSESHTGNFTQGQSGATYTTVSNAAAAGPSAGTVTLTQTLPAGLTLVSMSGTGWSCTGAICTRSDALNPGASYPVVTVTVNVAANAGSPLAIQASVSGGGSASAAATDNTVITPTALLSVSESHTGNFSQGQAVAAYTTTVANAATAGPTAGAVTLTQILPTGLTLVAMSGTGWSCTGISCTRSDTLNPGASYPPITVTVSVDPAAPAQVTNTATVSGGGDATPGHSVSDVTGIGPIADISGLVKVTQTGFGVNHSTKLWNATMMIANTSGAAIKGPIQVILTNLSPNATMVNNVGIRNGIPYITVSVGGLAAGASIDALIQFTNPSSGYIDYKPQTVSGIF
jgi:uncharacterized repeat protein (TIGR01451 family)